MSASSYVFLLTFFLSATAVGQKLSHDHGDRLQSISYQNSTSIGFTQDNPGNIVSIKRAGPLKVLNQNNGNSYSLIECGSWSSCEMLARTLYGELVSIRSKSEEEWLISTFPFGDDQIQSSFWIGANDLSMEGVWTWSSGEPFTYFNWHTGEPNNYQGNENVAHIRRIQGVYGWNDFPNDGSYGLRRAVIEFSNSRWDARKDFFIQFDPKGSWLYGRRLSGGAFQSLDRFIQDCPSLTHGISCWVAANDNTTLPMVAVDTTGANHRELTVEVPANALILHPGEEGDSAVVQFTVPQTGRYGVIASFESIDVTPFGVDVLMTVDGSPMIEQSLNQF